MSVPTATSNARGVFHMLLFVSVLPFLDALTKILVGSIEAPQVLALRFLMLAGVLAVPALLLPSPVLAAPPQRVLLLIRGALLGGASMFYVASLRYLQLSETAAIAMLFPLIVTAVSPFLLGERVGIIRYSAVTLGFVGAMLVVQPTPGGIGYGQTLALCAPLCFSAYVLMTRRMSGRAGALAQFFWTMIGAAIVTGIAAAPVWQPLGQTEWGIVILTGVLAFAVYMFQIGAFSLGEASVVTPFSYLSLATAAAVGYAIWGDIPNQLAMVGIVLIGLSGIIVAIRS